MKKKWLFIEENRAAALTIQIQQSIKNKEKKNIVHTLGGIGSCDVF